MLEGVYDLGQRVVDAPPMALLEVVLEGWITLDDFALQVVVAHDVQARCARPGVVASVWLDALLGFEDGVDRVIRSMPSFVHGCAGHGIQDLLVCSAEGVGRIEVVWKNDLLGGEIGHGDRVPVVEFD